MSKKIKTQSEIDLYAEDIFEQYSNSIGAFNVGEYEENFVKSLVYNCEGIFNEEDIFEVLKLLRKKELMQESILKNSFVKKASKVSSKHITEALKLEIEDFTYNFFVKHIDDNGNLLFSYEIECFTLPSLENSIVIGDNLSNIIYKDNGKSLIQDVIKHNKPSINFKINNLLILHKKENTGTDLKEVLNIIIVPKLESI